MGVAVGGFALCSLNLFELFHADFRLLTTYGLMAALDGRLLQLAELIARGAISRWPSTLCSRDVSTDCCTASIAAADRRRAEGESSGFGAGVDLASSLPADRPGHLPTLVRRQIRRTDLTALGPMRLVLIGDLGL